MLRPGTPLKVIPRRTHIVRYGISVYLISQRYAVSQYQLAKLNGLSPPFELKVGQRLQLSNTLDTVLDVGIPSGSTVQKWRAKRWPKKMRQPLFNANDLLRLRLTLPVALRGRLRVRSLLNLAPHSAACIMMASILQQRVLRLAARGRVAYVGSNIKSFGRLVLIKHDGGIIITYAHLGDIAVKEGDIVTVGQATQACW